MSTELIKRTSRNSVWLLGGQTAAQVLSLAFTVLVARQLGTEQFGQYVFAAAVASFLMIAAAFGLDLLVIRELTARPARTPETFSEAMLTRFLLWLAGSLLLGIILLISGVDRVAFQVTFLLGMAGLVTLFGNCSSAVMASRELFWPRVVAEATGNLLRVGSAYAAVKMGYGVLGVGGAVLLSSLLGSGMATVYTMWRFRLRPVWVPGRIIIDMIRRAAPYGIAALVFSLYFRMHVVMLSVIAGEKEAGLYGAAFKAIDAWILIPGSLAAAAYPLLARSAESQRSLYETTSSLLARALLAIGLPITALIVANPRDWLLLVYGAEYADAAGTLGVLALFLPLIAINYVLGISLYAAGYARRVLAAEVAALIVGFVCGILLIPRFGIVGAAASAVVMEVAVVGCNSWSLRTVLRMAPIRDAWLPALPASLLLGAILSITSFPVLLEAMAGLLLFAVLFLLMGGVRKEDRSWLAANISPGPFRQLLSHLGLLNEPTEADVRLDAVNGRKVGSL